ncbi:hypothetical protein [Parasphingorhabdus sp.]|uniref:hypothetical protein n=1 Tax=Parasphingorhabdus sp. TaxID=2709688 RepID=UPI0030035157
MTEEDELITALAIVVANRLDKPDVAAAGIKLSPIERQHVITRSVQAMINKGVHLRGNNLHMEPDLIAFKSRGG